MSCNGGNHPNSWVPAHGKLHAQWDLDRQPQSFRLCWDSQVKSSCLLALKEEPREELGSDGNHGGCHPQSTASEHLLFIHSRAWRELKETLHPTIKANQFPGLYKIMAECSLTTRVVPNGIKEACLDQQIPFSRWHSAGVWEHTGCLLGSVGHFSQGLAQLWSYWVPQHPFYGAQVQNFLLAETSHSSNKGGGVHCAPPRPWDVLGGELLELLDFGLSCLSLWSAFIKSPVCPAFNIP